MTSIRRTAMRTMTSDERAEWFAAMAVAATGRGPVGMDELEMEMNREVLMIGIDLLSITGAHVTTISVLNGDALPIHVIYGTRIFERTSDNRYVEVVGSEQAVAPTFNMPTEKGMPQDGF